MNKEDDNDIWTTAIQTSAIAYFQLDKVYTNITITGSGDSPGEAAINFIRNFNEVLPKEAAEFIVRQRIEAACVTASPIPPYGYSMRFSYRVKDE